jgi:hypothetical protein
MNDEVIRQRVGGRSVRVIARTHGCTEADVNGVPDHFAETVINDKVRKHTLALELTRLDEL